MKQLIVTTQRHKKAFPLFCSIPSLSARLGRLRSIRLGLIGLGLISLSSVLSAATVDDLTFTLINEGTEYAVTDCADSATGTLTIPATYEGKPVTEIRKRAFYQSKLTAVELPADLRVIGSYAFYASPIESIDLPAGLTALGAYAFASCSALTGSVTIPSGVTEIPDGLFSTSSALTEVILHDGITSIGKYAFISTKLQSIHLPAGLTALGRNAFAYCKSLTGSVTIPSGVTEIPDGLFSSSSALTEVVLHDAVTSIGANAFQSTALKSIRLPASLTALGSNAFSYCHSLTGSVTIPSGITEIPDYLFYVTALTGVVLHDAVTSIGVNAFAWTDISAINLPSSLKTIGDYAFANATDLQSITLPAGLTALGSNAFGNTYKLAEVRLEGAAPSLGTDAFKDAGRDVAGGTNFVIYDTYQSSYESSAGWSAFTFTVIAEPTAPMMEAFVLSTSLDASSNRFTIHSHGEPSAASASVLVQHRSSLTEGEWTAVASADVTESRDSETGVVTRSVSLSSSPASEGFYRLHYEGSASGGAE